jgi:hypothetical protein
MMFAGSGCTKVELHTVSYSRREMAIRVKMGRGGHCPVSRLACRLGAFQTTTYACYLQTAHDRIVDTEI